MREQEIARELADYQVALSAQELRRVACYLELLAHWNQRINLTAVREPRQMVRRLFGESLFLAGLVELKGWLVDVGSGAGFPGLALKLAVPGLRVSLVEARRKKCAFLKEVVRRCGFTHVNVVAERYEVWGRGQQSKQGVDVITTRAVAMDTGFIRVAEGLLKGGGQLILMTTEEQGRAISARERGFRWLPMVAVPGGGGRAVVIGEKKS